MVEQTLVDVPDLLDAEGLEAQLAGEGLAAEADPQSLERVEHVQHGAVVDRQRLRIAIPPGRAGVATLEEREAVGVEELSAVALDREAIEGDAAVHHAEEGEQSIPRVGAGLEHALALCTELVAEGRDGVGLAIDRFVEVEQPPLLGAEQHDQPHHHRDRRLVDPLGRDRLEQVAVLVDVGPLQAADQDLDRLADLPSQLVGDVKLVLAAPIEHPLGGLLVGDAEEPLLAQERLECLQGDRLGKEELRGPQGSAAGVVAGRVDQHPLVPVGEKRELHTGLLAELLGSGGGQVLPAARADRPHEVLLAVVDDHQHAGPLGLGAIVGVADQERRLDRLAVLGLVQDERLGDRMVAAEAIEVPLGGVPVGFLAAIELKGLLKHDLDPVHVDPRILRVVEPRLMGVAKLLTTGRVDPLEPLGKDVEQDRQTQERAVDVEQAQPLAVLEGHRLVGAVSAHGVHPSGTRIVTAIGKSRAS